LYLGAYLSNEPDTTLFEELNDSVPATPWNYYRTNY
jgi:hypothetical protein